MGSLIVAEQCEEEHKEHKGEPEGEHYGIGPMVPLTGATEMNPAEGGNKEDRDESRDGIRSEGGNMEGDDGEGVELLLLERGGSGGGGHGEGRCCV